MHALDFSDAVRVVVFFACGFSMLSLVQRFRKKHHTWNIKTKDYWYSLLMWSVAGFSLSIEGILRNRPFGPTLILVTAAALVSLKGLRRKGEWGGSD